MLSVLVFLPLVLSCAASGDVDGHESENIEDVSGGFDPARWLVWYPGIKLSAFAPQPRVLPTWKSTAASDSLKYASYNCIADYDTVCLDDSLYWVDSCGFVGQVAVACAQGCDESGCLGCDDACLGFACGPDGCGSDCGNCGIESTCVDHECHVAPYMLWSIQAGSTAIDVGWGVAMTADGDPLVAGYTFSQGFGIGDETIQPQGASDGFLARLDSSGNVKWVRPMASTSFDKTVAVVWTDNQRVCATGWFKSASIDLGGEPLLNAGGAGDNDDIFIGCYDPDGDHIWSMSAGGFGGDYPESLAPTSDGDLLLTGRSGGFGMSFGGKSLPRGILLARVSGEGDPEWAESFSVPENSVNVGRFISTAPGETMVVVGEFATSWLDLGDGPMNNSGAADAFVARFTAAGNLMWARAFGGGDADAALACRADEDGNVFVTGYLHSPTVTVGEGVVLHGPGAFLLKLSLGGAPLWGQSFGSTVSDVGRSLWIDSEGAILVAMDFSSSQLQICGKTYVSKGNTDFVLARLDGDGECLWARAYGGSKVETANSLAASPEGVMVITGAFSSQMFKFGDTMLSSDGELDLFVAAFRP